LVSCLKPGGEIAIWVYPNTREYLLRRRWIPFTSRIPNDMFYAWCRWFVPLMHRHYGSPLQRYVARVFPYSHQGLGLENDILDTFDGYSPRFHGVHSPQEVRGWFEDGRLEAVHAPSDWPTCMRGRKPRAHSRRGTSKG
jgi:hypothetical protein